MACFFIGQSDPNTAKVGKETYVLESPRENQVFVNRDNQPRRFTFSDEESRSEVEYYFGQFFVALAIHWAHITFGTLCLPILYSLFGKTLCLNMGFGWHVYYRYEWIPWS